MGREQLARFIGILVNITLVVLISYTLVSFSYDVLKGRMSLGRRAEIKDKQVEQKVEKRPLLSDYKAAIEKKPFGEPPPPEAVKSGEKERPIEPTTLKLRLLGTIVGDSEGYAAVIEDQTKKKQGLYKIGDKVQGATIASIDRGKVILRVGEKDQVLTFEEPKKGAKTQAQASAPAPAAPKAQTVTLQRAELDAQMQDLPKLMSQVNVAPHFKEGQPAGIGIHRITPGSIFQKMGLQNGDILVGVEGNPIKSPDDLINLYDRLKSAESVKLEVERGGVVTGLEYVIK